MAADPFEAAFARSASPASNEFEAAFKAAKAPAADPFEAAFKAHATKKTTAPARKPSPIAKESPFAAFVPIATGSMRTPDTNVGMAFDLVDRPRQATQAAITGGFGKFLPTLVHGQSPEGIARTRAELRTKLGMPGATERAQGHGFRGGLDDFALDTVTDPLLIGGVTGAIEKGVNAAGRVALPAFARGLASLERRGGDVGKVAHGIGGAFDAFNYKGATQRALAAKEGAAGMDKFAGLKSINNARSTKDEDLGNTFVTEFRDLTKGLSDVDRNTLYQAIHTGTEATLPANLQPLAKRFGALTDSLAHLSGTRSLRDQLAKGVNVERELHGPVQPPEIAAAYKSATEQGAAEHARDAAQHAHISEVLAPGSVKPDWVWKDGKWQTSVEFADVPKRFLNLETKPKFPPVKANGSLAQREPGNLDTTAQELSSHTGQQWSEGDVLHWLANKSTPPKRADFVAAAKDEAHGTVPHETIPAGPKSDEELKQDYLKYIEPMIRSGQIKTTEQIDQGAKAFIEQRRLVESTTPGAFAHPAPAVAPEPPASLGTRVDREGGGFALPAYAQRFDTSIRSLQRPTQYRKNYMPTAHDLDTPLGLASRPGSIAELDARIAGEVTNTRSLLEAQNSAKRATGPQTTRGLKTDDAALKERGDHAQLLDPELQGKVIEARLRSGAKAISARDAERETARLFGVGGFGKVPPAAKAFFQETYTKPDDKAFWAEMARGAIDLPKQALFALPFRHMANIGSLSVFADPSLSNVFGTAGRFARLLKAGGAPWRDTVDHAARSAALGKAEKYGVAGVPSIDRQGLSVPEPLVNLAKRIPKVGEALSGWTGKIPILGDLYKSSSNILWAFQDAATAQRFEKLRIGFQKDGLKESAAAYKAANQVGAELIDYSNRSPFTQALAYIAPFATYRSKLPGAIARTALRHPERVAIAGRLSPELVGDEQNAPNNLAGKTYLPLAETLRAVDDPWAYARATAGYPLRAAATAIGANSDPADGGYSRYFNYGKPIDGPFLLNAAVGAFPGAQAILDAKGLAEFPDQGVSGFVRGQTGIGLTRRPSPFVLVAKQHEAALQDAINAAHARGDENAAAALEHSLSSYRRYHS